MQSDADFRLRRRVAVAMGFFFVAVIGVAAYLAAVSGNLSPTRAAAPAIEQPGNPDFSTLRVARQDDEVAAELDDIAQTLARFPPAEEPRPERLAALAAIDAILHDEYASDRSSVQQFFHDRITLAATELRVADVPTGATVWHIYNHGFVVRTASATLCFDLVRAKYLPSFALPTLLMRRITDACDVLFVSHAHSDHAESFVADALLSDGKPVVAPAQVRYREPLYSRITHLDAIADKVQSVPIRNGSALLSVIVYPGHQEAEIDNNVVLVTTPEGITIAHTGDQWNRDADFTWIDRVGSGHHVDILLPNDWTYDIARMVKGFNPALVIPGHANELGHPVAKRQPYMLSYERKAGSNRFGGRASAGYVPPLVVLTWGESFHYERADKLDAMRSVEGAR